MCRDLFSNSETPLQKSKTVQLHVIVAKNASKMHGNGSQAKATPALHVVSHSSSPPLLPFLSQYRGACAEACQLSGSGQLHFIGLTDVIGSLKALVDAGEANVFAINSSLSSGDLSWGSEHFYAMVSSLF